MQPLRLLLCLPMSLCAASAPPGAAVPWTTYEAEEMRTTGVTLGPGYEPNSVESESSGRKCVRLDAAGQFLEFTAQAPAGAIVVRYSLPDSADGAGLDSGLTLYKNGKPLRKFPLTSRYSWLYGEYPFSNKPGDGKPRNFFDEVRLNGVAISKGDVLRLQRDADDVARYQIVDLVDLETVAPPLRAPLNSISLSDPRFGSAGGAEADHTKALRECIAAAKAEGKTVWVPPGQYRITGDIDLPSDVTIQGAGMWHTVFVGDARQYAKPDRRVRFNGAGSRIHLADFAISGNLAFRNDNEPNDGIGGSFGSGSTLSRLWVEHTKTGAWIVNSSGLIVESCRFRNTIADGINFCVGMRSSVIENCTTRGTGDDCFAIWPAAYTAEIYTPGLNVIRHCTGQLPFLANGAAIYGAEGNRVEDCLFTDLSYGCGVLISTTFPVGTNEFRGTTVAQRCNLVRCGGYDHVWQWRAALQLCLDRSSISGIRIHDINIQDSISDGLSIVVPANTPPNGLCALSNAVFEGVNIARYGIGVKGRHGFWVKSDAKGSATISGSTLMEYENNSSTFSINWVMP